MFAVFLSYRTTERGPGAYRINIEEASASREPQPLCRTGPTYNDVATYTGIYRTEVEAVSALLKAIDEPIAIWRREHHTGYTQHLLLPLQAKPDVEVGATNHLLGRRTSHGTWLAEAR